MERYHSGRPCRSAAGAPNVHVPSGLPIHTPAALQTTTTDADKRQRENNTGPLGGPVINAKS